MICALRHPWTISQLLYLIEWRAQPGSEVYEGILLVATVAKRRGRFLATIRQAIDLLKHYDRSRFVRLKTTARIIADTQSGESRYRFPMRAIETDLSTIPADLQGQGRAAYMAGVLVHESTHGVILRRTTGRNSYDFSVRGERLCFREQARFLQRVRDAGKLSMHYSFLARSYGAEKCEVRSRRENRRLNRLIGAWSRLPARGRWSVVLLVILWVAFRGGLAFAGVLLIVTLVGLDWATVLNEPMLMAGLVGISLFVAGGTVLLRWCGILWRRRLSGRGKADR